MAGLGDEGTEELFRRLLEYALWDLIGAELTTQIGASGHERSDTRSNWRNGGRTRTLFTPAGDVDRVPKVRVGSFFSALLEPRRRVDKALWAVIMTAYITGSSTRKVEDLVKALGCDTGVSKSSVSRICGEIDEHVAVFRTRSPSRVFQGTTWQRCRVHLMRNLLAHVPKGHKEMIAATVRTIFAQPDPRIHPGSAASGRRHA